MNSGTSYEQPAKSGTPFDGDNLQPRQLRPGQRSQLWIADVKTGSREMIFESDEILFEAPNWTLDGVELIVNGDGRLWSIPIAAPALTPIDLQGVPDLNNDHVLDPDGEHIYVSAMDWHIYRAPLRGGAAHRVTGRSGIDGLMHFLHGVSPDGRRLAFIGVQLPDGVTRTRIGASVYTMSTTGDDYLSITDTEHSADGSEYSPDGRWLFFNTEQFTGHAQLARVPVHGGQPEQLRVSETVDWFPHLSPNGRRASYLAFPPGTEGHPPDLWVQIMTVQDNDWAGATEVARIFGGQGSLNVNSWHPGSGRFAYVAYPQES